MIALLIAAAAAALQPASAKPQAHATPAANTAVGAEIRKLEHDWGEAFVKRDFAFLERIVAPEFRLFVAHPDGRHNLAPRAMWMRNARNFRYAEFVVETVDVNLAGDTAVATVQVFNRVAMKPGEAPKPHRSFLTDTWVRRNGKWQVIHRYSHRLPDATWPPVKPAAK